MGKTVTEIMKILITSILSVFMTLVIVSGSIINKKADKVYVDTQDDKIIKSVVEVKKELKEDDQKLKAEYIRELDRMNDSQEEMQRDIKKILEKL